MEEHGISHRTVEVNGISIHVAEKGEGPVVLLVHGFPELWYSWRHQILGLAARGYRALAPDLRGYGDSSAPPTVASYSVFHIVGDLVALLDALAIPQEPGAVEAEFDRLGTESLLRMLFASRNPGPFLIPKEAFVPLDWQIPLPDWLSEEDISYFTRKFDKSGFTGPVNYYRCLDLNWELGAPWCGVKIQVPVKFIVGDLDLTYHYPGIQDYLHRGGFKDDVPMLEEVVVMEGVAHFINQEKAPEITDHIYHFIRKF
ncbi:alpha/beta hydrolase fold [Musa troglodytarum]|uniref:Alpha/beta hydrolase fold n=1 Tax=Musa troglodytarum TaxID=320322 RepID=A0A9E7EEF0_9LILI|nr:alpha/beta hydrolase fold [Musa troglodytarum]